MATSDDGRPGPSYDGWLDAALHGNLASYLYNSAPTIAQIVPGYRSDEGLGQKILDYGSVPARLLASSVINPLLEGGDAFRRFTSGDMGPGAQRELSSAALGTLMLGLASSPGRVLKPDPTQLNAFTAYHGTGVKFPAEVKIQYPVGPNTWPGADRPLTEFRPAEGPFPPGAQVVEHLPFGRFRDDKIGAGEGAQMYGYGHYVGIDPEIPGWYMEQDLLRKSRGAEPDTFYYKGNQYHRDEVPGLQDTLIANGEPNASGLMTAVEYWHGNNYDHDLALTQLQKEVSAGPTKPSQDFTAQEVQYKLLQSPKHDHYQPGEIMSMSPEEMKQKFPEEWGQEEKRLEDQLHAMWQDKAVAAEWLRHNATQLQAPKVEAPPEGSFYQVHVIPDKDTFLNWDKKISDQSEYVQNVLRNNVPDEFKDAFEEGWFDRHAHYGTHPLMEDAWDDWRGKHLMYGLAGHFEGGVNNPEVSNLLRSWGINGVEYRDANSRKWNPTKLSSKAQQWQEHVNIYSDLINDLKKQYGDDVLAGMQAQHMDNPKHLDNLSQLYQYHVSQLDDAKKKLADVQNQLAIGPTNNYVVFDPSHLRIEARNGQLHELVPVYDNPFARNPHK